MLTADTAAAPVAVAAAVAGVGAGSVSAWLQLGAA